MTDPATDDRPAIAATLSHWRVFNGNTVLLNQMGLVVAYSPIQHGQPNKSSPLQAPKGGDELKGIDYLALCRSAAIEGDESASELLEGIGRILSGEAPFYRNEFVTLPEGSSVEVAALCLPGTPVQVAVSHIEKTGAQSPNRPAVPSSKSAHAIFDAANLGYVVIDSKGRVLDLNEAYQRFTGYASREALIGHHVYEWTERSDHNRLKDAIDRCAKSGNTHRVEIEHHRPQGDPRTIAMNVATIQRDDPHRLVAFCFDLTEQKRHIRAQRQNDDRYRAVVETQTELVCRYLADTTLTFVNEAYCRFFNLPRAQLVGRKFIDFIPPETRPTVFATLQKVIESKRPSLYEHEVIAPDQSLHWQEWVDIPIYDQDGNLVELQGIGRDITDQRRAEDDLRRSHHQIRDLASRLIRAQEKERKAIAQELHDDLSQRMAAHAIAISNLKRHLPETSDAFKARFNNLENEAMELGDAIRLLSHQLHPAVLEHLGLPAALRSFCSEFADRSRLAFHVDIQETAPPLSDQTALTLYRVAQEMIHNINRHAHACHVHVHLTFESQDALLSIEDDGVGFDIKKPREKSGLGLISLEERVLFLGGQLRIDSGLGQGTRIHVRIPYQKGLA